MKKPTPFFSISTLFRTSLLFILLTAGAVHRVDATVYYVHSAGSDGNAGTSWEEAFQTLQKAVEATAPNDEIWVASGTYLPTKNSQGNPSPADPRTKTFFINKDIRIYGGFSGTESSRDERDWASNVTVLSGDIGAANNSADNAYHVVWINYRTSAMVLDGFTVTLGNANGIFEHSNGGGILNHGVGQAFSSNPTISNCIFTGNAAHPTNGNGGGFYNRAVDGNAYPVFTNCSFTGNSAHNGGGFANHGIFGGDGHPSFAHCVFTGNTANYGGAIYNDGFQGNGSITAHQTVFSGNQAAHFGGAIMGGNFGSTPYITAVNCLFSGNRVLNFAGGAVFYDDYASSVSPTFTNCTFSANYAPNGGIMHYQRKTASSPAFNNCILYGNNSLFSYQDMATPAHVSINYSIVQGGWTGGGGNNLGSDPLFVDQPPFANAPTAAGDFHLQPCSPAINAGSNALVPAYVTADLDGNDRVVEATVDMGAYEYQEPSMLVCYQDIDGDTYGNSGVTQSFCSVCGPGYVPYGGDCDDADANVHPGAMEVCGNAVDENCNETMDEGCCDLQVSLPECRTVYIGYAPAASTTLTPTLTGGNGSPAFLWSNGATTESITVSPTTHTIYTVTVTTAGNCTASASVLVESVDVRCGPSNQKVLVCHKGSTALCVEPSDAADHLDHGDALGPCNLVVCDPYQPDGLQRAGHHDLGEELATSLGTTVFPNPAPGKITVVFGRENTAASYLTVKNSIGQVVLFADIEPGASRLDLDVSLLEPGVYFLAENRGTAVRFVKR